MQSRQLGRVRGNDPLGYARRAAALALVASFAAVGIAHATIPSENVISACYSRSGGNLRVIDATVTKCSKSETALAWNVQGIKGDTGETGAQGPAGPAGPSGLSAGYAGALDDPLEILVPTTVGQVVISKTALAGNYILTARLRFQTDNAFSSAVCWMPGDDVTVVLHQNEPEYVTMTAGVSHGGGALALVCRKGGATDHPSYYVLDARLTAVRVDTLN